MNAVHPPTTRAEDVLLLAESLAQEALKQNGAEARPTWPPRWARERVRQAISSGESGRLIGRAILLLTRFVAQTSGRMEKDLRALHDRLEQLQAPTSVDDRLYFDFENRFRGSSEEIRRRIECYRSFLDQVLQAQPCRRAVEIGCGRGELAGLLRSMGFEYLGYDLNARMVECAREDGHQVVKGDGFAALEREPDGSLAVVASLHVIEHVSFAQLVTLTETAARKLVPDGALVLETPNGTSFASLANFHLDPTHQKPVHPELLIFLCERAGLKVLKCSPTGPGDPLELMPQSVPGAAIYNRNIARISQLLVAGGDLALVAQRPKE